VIINRDLIFALIFFGFYPFLLLVEMLNLEGSLPAIAYRISIGILCLYYIVSSPSSLNTNTLLYSILGLAFLFLFVRTCLQLELEGFSAAEKLPEITVSIILSTLIPAIFLIKEIPNFSFRKIASFVLLISFFFSILLFHYMFSSIEFYTRLGTEKVNPIAIGSFYTSAILFFLSGIIHVGSTNIPRIISLAIIVISIFIVFLSQSRGPVLGLMLALPLFARKSKKTILVITILSVPVLFLTYIYFLDLLSTNLVDTYILVGGDQDVSANVRYDLYGHAWQIFLDNPILGGNIIVPEYNFYTHNIFLDILISTGLIGFLVLLPIFLIPVLKIKKHFAFYHSKPIMLFALVIWIKSFIVAQFSGFIFYHSEFWIITLLILTLYPHFGKYE
jgi:O-antigen ligase